MISCLEYVNERKLILKEKVSKFKNKPCLAVVHVGNDEASNIYIRNKEKVCNEIGIGFIPVRLKESISEEELIFIIKNRLNCDKNIHGIIVQLPLPKHINPDNIINSIAKNKDVDGFRYDSKFNPCTPKGIIDWLKYNQVDLAGKDVCIIGRSEIVGKPLSRMMCEENATVTLCHSKTRDLRRHTKGADIIVCAIGKANYIDASYFDSYFSAAQIVIDVGINRDSENKLCGDVHKDVSNIVAYKTPVPNGVGKLTVCSLMENTVKAYRLNGGV